MYHPVTKSIFKISAISFKILNFCRKKTLLEEIISKLKNTDFEISDIRRFILKMLKYNILKIEKEIYNEKRNE